MNMTFYMTFDITFMLLLSDINAVKHNLNPCQPNYVPHQSFVMEAEADDR